ncbi:MAG: serine/threonine-protein kinase [Bradymonadia bacterium]
MSGDRTKGSDLQQSFTPTTVEGVSDHVVEHHRGDRRGAAVGSVFPDPQRMMPLDPFTIPAWFRRPADSLAPVVSPFPETGATPVDAGALQRSDTPIHHPPTAGELPPEADPFASTCAPEPPSTEDDGMTIREIPPMPRPGASHRKTQHTLLGLNRAQVEAQQVASEELRTVRDVVPPSMDSLDSIHRSNDALSGSTDHRERPVDPTGAVPMPQTPVDPHMVAGRYKIRCRIGTGGMGVVYLAEDTRLHGRLAALKVLNPWGQPEVEKARFEREVRVISRLRNPHTVQVSDAGLLPDQRPFIVMEYIEGHSLGDLLDQVYALPPIQALEVIECVLVSLEEAHARGVIHRDLKPDNIMIRRMDGRRMLVQPVLQIKVLDFGIARDYNAGQREQRILDRRLSGTPAYMAPELFASAPSDARSDIYSVGVLLYHMLAGRLPFDPDDQLPPRAPKLQGAMRMAWMHQELPPRYIPNCPEPLWGLILSLLSKPPGKRPHSAAMALEQLERVKETLGVQGEHPLVPPPSDSYSGDRHFREAPQPLLRPQPAQPRERRLTPPALANRSSFWSRSAMVLLLALVGAAAVAVYFARDAEESGFGDPVLDTPSALGSGVLDPGGRSSKACCTCASTLTSDPPGAEVWLGNTAIGQTPMTLDRPCSEIWQLRLTAPGHQPRLLRVEGRSPTGRPFHASLERD